MRLEDLIIFLLKVSSSFFILAIWAGITYLIWKSTP